MIEKITATSIYNNITIVPYNFNAMKMKAFLGDFLYHTLHLLNSEKGT